MNRAMMILAMCGLTMAMGCEEKKAEPPKTAGDAAKAAMDGTKDATKTAGDVAKAAASDMGTKAVTEAKGLVDKAKAQLDTLTKAGASLPADKKPMFDAAVAPLNDQYKSLSDAAAKLKDLSGDNLAKTATDLKDRASKLVDGITSVAAKFGVKL